MTVPCLGRRRRRRSCISELLEKRVLLSASTDINDWAEVPLPEFFPHETNVAMGPFMVAGTAATATQPVGALTGKIVYTAAGHGFTWSESRNLWSTQRGNNNQIVEDLGNQDQMTMYIDYLFSAGATVVPMRPVGHQPNEVIVDNVSSGAQFFGTWNNSVSTIYYGNSGEVPYRWASVSTTETSFARYTPNIPQAGFYPVYTWARHGSDRVNQLYRIVHPGGAVEVRVNHKRVGLGWVYLGTYYFNQGTSGYVEISNQVPSGSGVIIADAIRFGNGMGDIKRGSGPISFQTREDEAALYWIEAQKGQGVSDSTFRGGNSQDGNANVGAPPRWAAHMNRETDGHFTDRVFLSFHTNASTGSARGTVGLYNGNNNPSTKTPNQQEWAFLVAKEINTDLVAIGSPPLEFAFHNRSDSQLTLDRSDIEFGEINNNSLNGEMDATIIEVAYHDNVTDAALLRDPKVRNWAARSSYQATVKYFNTYHNGNPAPLVLIPDSPTNARTKVQANGDVTVSWTPAVVNTIGGHAPTGFVIFRSVNGYAYGDPIVVSGGSTTSHTIPASQIASGVNYFRVVATNAGGHSLPSEVVAARVGPTGAAPILIVNGYDRMDKSINVRQTAPISGPGTSSTFDRIRPRFINSFDYVVQGASAIASYHTVYGIDSAQNEAIISGAVNLSDYKAVIWLSGRESVADKTFDPTEQSLVSAFINNGGKFFVSGQDIGFDLVGNNNGASFYNNILKTTYSADSAGGYTASGVSGTIFAGISLTFDNGSQVYNVNSPDRIGATGGSVVAMNYTGSGSGGAAIQFENTTTGARIVNMGFPFETITTVANRNAVMHAVLDFFGPLNAGIGRISGQVFRDVNADGLFNGADTALSGVMVFIDNNNNGFRDPDEPFAISNSSGDYEITDLLDGTYTVRQAFISGFVPTAPLAGHVVNVSGGAAVTGRNFGNFPTVYNGTAGADMYTVRMDPAGNGRVQIIEQLAGSSSLTYSIDKSELKTITLLLGAGDDLVVIDHAFGNPVPSTSLSIAGDAHDTFGDWIVIHGTSGADVFNLSNTAITGAGNIPYFGIERIIINAGNGNDVFNYNGPVSADVTFNASGGFNTVNINGGTYTFAGDASASIANPSININAGSVMFDASQRLTSLSVASGASATMSADGERFLDANNLTIASGGRLDLNDNALIVNYTGANPFTTLFDYVVSGHRLEVDPDATGIVSTHGQQRGGDTILALIDNEPLGWDNWMGVPIDSTTIFSKYTLFGDANLDGQVTGDDFAVVVSNLGNTGMPWYMGDMNFDGSVTGDDVALVIANLGKSLNPGAGPAGAQAMFVMPLSEDDEPDDEPDALEI